MNKNNSPEQKAQWKANQKLGSRFVRVIPSTDYTDYLAACFRQGHGGRDFDAQGRRTA